MDTNLKNEQPAPAAAEPSESGSRSGHRILARAALALPVLAIAAVAGLAVLLVQALRTAALSGLHIRLTVLTGWAVAAMAVLGILAALAALLQKRSRKRMAVCGLVLSMLLLTVSAGGLFAYQYLFSAMDQDDQLHQLSGEELYAAGTKEDGEILRSTLPTDATMPTEIPGEEVEWVSYTYDQIPAEARAHLDSAPPANPSYLLDGSDEISMFMIFGLDKIDSSDAMILFAVDRPHQKIKMISLARDTYACYPAWGENGYTRLAYPYTYGGVSGALMTINHNFTLNISDYVSAKFDQLVDLVDLVGGVDVDINDNEYQILSRLYYGIHRGPCHLDGEAALTYSRIRNPDNGGYYEGEEQRTGRQREVIGSILQTVRQMPITEFPAFIRACLGMCTTSLRQEEILDLALEVVQGDYTLESYALVEQIDHWKGLFGPQDYFYYVYDFNRASDWIYRTVYEDLYRSGYDTPAAAG